MKANETRPARAASRDRPSIVGSLLLLVFLVAGLWAVVEALDVTLGRRQLIGKRFGIDGRVILGALALGGACLLGSFLLRVRAWRRTEPRDGGLGTPLRLLFEMLVLGSACYLAYLQPFRREIFDVALGLTMGVWGAALLTSLLMPDLPSLRALKALDLILFNLCLFAVLMECGLRLTACYSSSVILAQADLRSIEIIEKRKQRHWPGRLRFGFPLNSQGHYDTDFDRTGRVALIGDSFSFGPVPHHYHFSTVAERETGLEIYNYGYPGISPPEYLYLLRHEAIQLDPASVVVNIFVGNDIFGYRYDTDHRLLRLWFDRVNLLAYQVPKRLWRLQAENRALGNQQVGAVEGEQIRRRLRTVEEMTAEYPWLLDPSLEKQMFSEKRFLQIETRRATLICDPARVDYSVLIAVLRDMRRVAGGRPFAVHILPDEFQVDDELWNTLVERTGRPELVRDLPQQILAEKLAEEGIPFLDLLPIFRANCAAHHRGKQHCYHLRNTHFNARGNRVAGEAMAPFLARLAEP
ncbi:MAG: hypothetical protein GY719_31880 [bacterium]|nr:hypothetical protein [bacterium]